MKASVAGAAVLGIAVGLTGATSLSAQEAPAEMSAAHIHRVFDISREGSRIGTDTVDIVRNGDVTSVKMQTQIRVKIAFLTAYRYDHAETGVWKGAQLVSFTSNTDDNGKSHLVKAAAAGNKVALIADGAQTAAPRAVQPASLWSAELSKLPQIFDPASGKRMAVATQDLGKETVRVNGVPREVTHIRLSGEFARDLWFDGEGLVKMSMLGSDNSRIVSELRPSTADAE